MVVLARMTRRTLGKGRVLRGRVVVLVIIVRRFLSIWSRKRVVGRGGLGLRFIGWVVLIRRRFTFWWSVRMTVMIGFIRVPFVLMIRRRSISLSGLRMGTLIRITTLIRFGRVFMVRLWLLT